MLTRLDTIRRRASATRQRGVTLIEAILYLSVASSVIVLMASLMDTESKRQEDITMASGLNMVSMAAQRYVAAEYDMIRNQLLAAARATGRAEIEVTAQDLADGGYLPDTFAAGTENIFGQRPALLMRAVSVDDGSEPQATMTETELDANSDGNIDNHLVDLDNSNDEATIEAILVTTGGEPVPATRGPQIAVRTQRPTSGFLSEPDVTRGAYGSFAFDISGFSDFASYPAEGRFANIIALSRFGVIDMMGGETKINTGVPDPLQRCAEILERPGMTPDSDIYVACLASNDMYNDIVFNNYDADDDGVIDTFPSVRNVNTIEMSGATDTDGNGNPDVFSKITDLYDIEMGAPVDTDGNGTPDAFSSITNLSRVACDDTADTAIEGTLIIDCDTLVADGDMIVGGNATIGGDATADRFISSEMDGQDLSEGIYNALLLASGNTIDKPVCPPVTADGAYQMEPRIFVVPAAYSHPGGLPTVGVRAYAEEAGGDAWRVRLFNFVDEDKCTSSISNPLTTETSDFRSENSAQCSSADGLADVYEVSSTAGRVLAMTRCY